MSSSRRYLPVAAACSLVALASSKPSVDSAVQKKFGIRQDSLQDKGMDEEFLVGEQEMEKIIPASTTPPATDDEEATWRSDEEWWKDPLAFFSDDEEEEDDEGILEELQEEEDLLLEEIPEEAGELQPEEQEFYPDQEEEEDDFVEEEMEQAQQDLQEEEEDDVEQDLEEYFEEEEEEEDDLENEEALEEEQELEDVNEQVEIVKDELQEGEADLQNEVEELSAAAKKRLADNDMVPSTETKESSTSFSSPSAFLLPMAPKVRTFLSACKPAYQILGAAAAAGALFPLLSKGQQSMAQWQEQKQAQQQQGSYDDQELFDERNYDDNVEESQAEELENDAVRKSPTFVRPTVGFLERMSNMVPSGNRQKIPSAKRLLEERDSLLQRAQRAEAERDNMEREYEKTSWQLQEVQSDLQAQSSTTKYLKAQLRDNEQMMDRAIRAERARAKEELKRMKEAMLRVLERERQAMRDEVKRQSAELQALLEEANNGTASSHA